jgi:uncharacterized protein (DUF2267 family)
MRTAVRRAAGVLAVAGVAVLLRHGTRANRLVRQGCDEAGRQLRYLRGHLRGASYRLRGQRPDPEVIDNVLADRIRSSLGPLEKRLDLPHVHVMVDDHIALLHGEVTSEADVDELMQAVAAVSGVVGVESYLHVGLTGGDSRPSAGRVGQPPSDAMKRLLDAIGSDVDPESSRPVLRAILATFADRLPAGERDRLAAHLPADVRVLFTAPRRTKREAPPRTVHELVARIAAATSELPGGKAEQITAAVLSTLRLLVPEEERHVSAVLPPELRDLWEGQVTE